MIRVLIADDHTLVRAGIRVLVDALAGIEVVAEAGDGREALYLISEHAPDVALVDVAMPGLNGLEVLDQIVAEFPYTHVVILSMHANEEYVLRAVRSGAAGYLLKDAGPTELELAIRAAARNETYLTPAVSRHVAEYLRRIDDDARCDLAQPTPRQRQVLQLVAEGHTTQSIAHELGISTKTVETHRMHLMQRLGIHDIAGLVRYAIEHGIIHVHVAGAE